MTEARHHIHLIGFNHNTMALTVRERYFLDHVQFRDALGALSERYAIGEQFLIATCNRLEIVLVTTRKLTDGDILDFFIDLQRQAGNNTLPSARDELAGQIYRYYQKEAIDQLFAVCCGLDSLVLGETQITGQFKKAMQLAKQEGWLGPVLDRLTQEALATAGKVRTFTEISKKTVSISHMAIHLANRLAGDLSKQVIALIGAGEMSALAARYLVKYQPRELVILNRTPERAHEIVGQIGMGRAAPLDELPAVLASCGVLICSTAKKGYLITRQMVSEAMAKRKSPIFLIDISLPRNIDIEVATMNDVYLFDVDDIKQIVAAHVEERSLAAEKARGIIIDSSLAFLRWMNAQSSSFALSGFRDYLEKLFHNEMQRTFSKSKSCEMAHDHAEEIRTLLEAIAARLTTHAAKSVNNPPAGFYREQLASALKVLFPTDDSPVTLGVLRHDTTQSDPAGYPR